jgi:cytochrome c-type biogenesis protein CcsB
MVPHSLALALRWAATGHGPYMMQYEVLSSNAWIAVAMLLVFLRRRPVWTPVALAVLPAAVILIAVGLFSNPEARDLPPSLRSTWLVFHVVFNKLAAGAFLLALGAAIALLLKARGKAGRLLARLPDVDGLDAVMMRLVGFGFVFWTVTIAAGAVWANQSWGRYWGWDPIEAWSLVTWLCYGSLLHARLFYRVRGGTAAWLVVGCFVICVLTIFVLPFVLPSLHAVYFQ